MNQQKFVNGIPYNSTYVMKASGKKTERIFESLKKREVTFFQKISPFNQVYFLRI